MAVARHTIVRRLATAALPMIAEVRHPTQAQAAETAGVSNESPQNRNRRSKSR